jgi:hypothetical protein
MAGIQGPAGVDGTVFVWRGEWSASETYVADDAVYDPVSGAAFLANATNKNDPPDGSANWDTLVDPRQGWVTHIQKVEPDHDHYQKRLGWPLNGDIGGSYHFSLAYDPNNRLVTLTDLGTDTYGTAGQIRYYRSGNRVIKDGPISLAHAATEAGYFFYFDQADAFVVSTTPWDLSIHVPVAYVYWNGTDGVCYEERHTIYRDPQIHEALHFAIGTFAQEGFALTDYTLNQGDAAGIRFTIGAGVVRDEDLPTATPEVRTGDYTIAYRSGATGAWQFTEDLDDPVLKGTTYAQWNEFTGATWQLTEAAANKFLNYWVYAVPSIDDAIKILIVPGQSVFSSQLAAEGEVPSSMLIGDIVAQEIAAIYRITFKTSAAHTSFGKVEINQVDQVFATRGSTSSVVAPTDHAALTGTSAAGSHPASAISSVAFDTIAATNVQDALEEIQAEVPTAAEVPSDTFSTITSTNVQDALEEVHAEAQAVTAPVATIGTATASGTAGSVTDPPLLGTGNTNWEIFTNGSIHGSDFWYRLDRSVGIRYEGFATRDGGSHLFWREVKEAYLRLDTLTVGYHSIARGDKPGKVVGVYGKIPDGTNVVCNAFVTGTSPAAANMYAADVTITPSGWTVFGAQPTAYEDLVAGGVRDDMQIEIVSSSGSPSWAIFQILYVYE